MEADAHEGNTIAVVVDPALLLAGCSSWRRLLRARRGGVGLLPPCRVRAVGASGRASPVAAGWCWWCSPLLVCARRAVPLWAPLPAPEWASPWEARPPPPALYVLCAGVGGPYAWMEE